MFKDVCLPGWNVNPSNCRCYKFIQESVTWTEANKRCQEIAPTNQPPNPPVTRRHLAAIENVEENNFVANLVGGKKAWLGGFKFADGTWGWTDGLKWEGGYTNWRRGQGRPDEPNNFGGRENSLLINWSGYGLWNDSPYQNKYSFVCQYLDLTKLSLCKNQK